MNITRIEVARLYNLGSYEHISYKLSADVKEGESAEKAMLGLEKIISALSPKTSTHSRLELEREKLNLDNMHERFSNEGPDEFRRYHGHFVGTPEEYIARCEQSHAENVIRRDEWEARNTKARKMLDDLGGAAVWKDAKLDWEYKDDDY